MSVILGLRKLSKVEIDILHTHPETVMPYLFGEEAANFNSGIRRNVWNFLKELIIKKKPVLDKSLIPEFLEEDEIDLDKSWHILHYLFTGSADGNTPPGCYLLEGGSYIDYTDIDYKSVYTYNPPQVKEFLEFVSQFNEQTIKQKFDIDDMNKQQIYIVDSSCLDDKEELLLYTLEYFEILKTFLNKAVKEEKGMIIFMC